MTPERYEAQLLGLVGPRRDASDEALDKDALTTIGIDLDAVREQAEAAFGPGALSRAPSRRRGLRRRTRTVTGHLPITRRVRRCLASSRHQARELSGGRLGAGHIALALLEMDEGLPPQIL